MATTTVKFTYQDLLTAPEDTNRYEIFEGELIVTPSPTTKHQNAVFNLTLLLGQHVKENKFGKMFSAPMDVYFDEGTVVEPDLLYISKDRIEIIEERRINGAPDLLVEILSPGTADRDRGFKFHRYAKEGVKEYWIVDPIDKKLEIFVLDQNSFNLHGRFLNDDAVSGPMFSDLSFSLGELWK
jgi:Uma2 family endonuclease